MSDLTSALENLAPNIQQVLRQNHFDPERFQRLAKKITESGDSDNCVRGELLPPGPDDIQRLPSPGSDEHTEYQRIGEEALRAGQCAFVLLAGGMATRMGGVVKALVEALPGHTFLELRLQEMDALARRFGARPPLALMTSYATDADTRAALGARRDGTHIATFPQHVSLRLTPDAKLYLDESGAPSLHAHGHGDFLDAYRQSGLLERFCNQGGRVVMVANLDNLGASLDPAVVGFHLAGGLPCTSEVVDKVGSDRGGIPVRLDNQLVVLEEFRLPPDFDPTQVSVFNINTFCFDAPSLLALDMDWTYFTVKKQVENSTVIQFERLINELTFQLETRYLHVPRSGAPSRFLPVKDYAELKARQAEIQAALAARGVIDKG